MLHTRPGPPVRRYSGKNILGKTIGELNEDAQIKENYMKKLKNDHQSFIYKAEQNEKDMNILLERQKTIICELQGKLNKINVNTQNCSTQTTGLPHLDTVTEPQSVYTRGIGRKVEGTVSSRYAQESTSQTEWLDQGAYEDPNNSIHSSTRGYFHSSEHVYPIQTSQPPRIDTMATVTQHKNSASIPDDSPNPISLPQGTFQTEGST
ncbi:hypothetical protein JTB14_025524 [Gonioctena quinquepunctata]|nr:hypothetical protein JTB14_025524 [Gonioctena quinquepunctata]